MILKRLFDTFYANRLIVFMTSNRPPEDLYLNGLQRDLFLPFIDDLKANCEVVNLSSIDYRLLHSMGMDSYYYPGSHNNNNTEKEVDKMWDKLTNNAVGKYMSVEVAQGRTIPCQKQAKNVAQFTFKELCESNRGSTDYMAIAETFQTIIIRGIPQLSMERRDFLRRFISLVDSLYYNHCNVVCEAAVSIESLFAIS